MGCGASSAGEVKAEQPKPQAATVSPVATKEDTVPDKAAEAAPSKPSGDHAQPTEAEPVKDNTEKTEGDAFANLTDPVLEGTELSQTGAGAKGSVTDSSLHPIEAAALNASIVKEEGDLAVEDAARRRASFIGPMRTLGRSFAVKQRALLEESEGSEKKDEEGEVQEETHHEKMIRMYLNKTPALEGAEAGSDAADKPTVDAAQTGNESKSEPTATA